MDAQVRTKYTNEFHDWAMKCAMNSASEVAPFIKHLIAPESVCDVGCGLGQWLVPFLWLGVQDVLGIDNHSDIDHLLIPPDRFISCDLECSLPEINRQFDLAIYLEVAEHLSSERAVPYVELLSRLAPVILFSAATPGQGGTGHINEQEPQYWEDIFAKFHYVPVDCIRPEFANNNNVVWWYKKNMLLYVRKDKLANYPFGLDSEDIPVPPDTSSSDSDNSDTSESHDSGSSSINNGTDDNFVLPPSFSSRANYERSAAPFTYYAPNLEQNDQFNRPVDTNYFKSAFVINLKRRPDRLTAFYTRFPKDWDFIQPTVFYGIDGHKTGADKHHVYGSWGCLMSHLSIMEKAMSEDLLPCIVFEDDFDPYENFTQSMHNYLEHLPSDYRLAYFGGQHHHKWHTHAVNINPYVAKPFSVIRTHGQIYNNNK